MQAILHWTVPWYKPLAIARLNIQYYFYLKASFNPEGSQVYGRSKERREENKSDALGTVKDEVYIWHEWFNGLGCSCFVFCGEFITFTRGLECGRLDLRILDHILKKHECVAAHLKLHPIPTLPKLSGCQMNQSEWYIKFRVVLVWWHICTGWNMC